MAPIDSPIPLRDPMVHDLHTRVDRLEQHTVQAREREHLRDIEFANLRTDVRYVKEGQDKLYAGINRILWAIGLAVLAAGTTFVLSGGLVIVQQN